MRAYVVSLVVVVFAGCSPRINKCADQTLFIDVTLDEASRQADLLAVDVRIDNGAPRHSDLPHTAGKGAGGILVEFPGGYPAGKSVAITIVAKASGASVGTGTANGTLAAGCDALSIDVKGSGGLPDLSGADLSTGADAQTDTDLGDLSSSADLSNADLDIRDLSLPGDVDLQPVADLTPPRDLVGATTVTNVDTPKADGTFGAGTTIDILVNFTAAVTVTGSPTLQLNITNVSGPVVADYQSGSGTTQLVFRYVVLSGHESAKLDYAGTSALSTNGGTITAGGMDAALFLPLPGSTGSLGATHNVVINTALLRFQYGGGNPPMADSFGTTNSNLGHSYVLKNEGGGPTGAITVALTSDTPSYWAKPTDQCNGQSLSSGQTCPISVVFLAGTQDQNAGSASAQLTATGSRGASTSHSLSGTAAYGWMPSTSYGTQFAASPNATTATTPMGACPAQNAYELVEYGSSPGGLQTTFNRDPSCDASCPGNWCYQSVSPSGLRTCDGTTTWNYVFGSGGGVLGTTFTCFPVGTSTTAFTKVANIPQPPNVSTAGACDTVYVKVVRDYRCR